MGCASSKQKVCRKCKAPYTPVRRSFSTHHRRKKSGDANHMVSLTSSTLGSLKLDPLTQNEAPFEQNQNPGVVEDNPWPANREDIVGTKTAKEEFAMSMIEAKTWSEMIDKKIPKIVPKTPIRTPPGEPETINVWELMEGLEGISPVRQVHHFRSFSFHVSSHASLASIDDQTTPRIKEEDAGNGSPLKPSLNLDSADSDSNSNSNSNSIDTSIICEFDPDVIASFRKALEELPPASPFHLKPIEKASALEVTNEKDAKGGDIATNKMALRNRDKLIVYFTSLRGVRRTYEDCCHVRVILKGLGVKVDERDVSMHSRYKEELKELLGEAFGGLPRVFVGKKYIGGADEIRRLNEEGKLEKTVESCELVEDGNGNGNGNGCEACGDIRFVPCGMCSGSCKIYHEGDYDDDVDECDEVEQEYGFQRCPDCNENGLIRCPICCDD